jgi:putative glutamine amidotransferase
LNPRIGLTASAKLNADYFAAVRDAGGAPIVLANDVARIAADILDLDGLLVSGGVDVDPAFYGQEKHPKTDQLLEHDRDAYESALLRAAHAAKVPVLAICRGMQMANVAFGGSLIQHLADAIPGGEQHESGGVPGLKPDHIVHVVQDSHLAKIAGSAVFPTSSRHHQAIDRVAAGFRIVARTADGVIEAIEPENATFFWIGVQWHPETTAIAGDEPSRALFRAFIEAASSRH